MENKRDLIQSISNEICTNAWANGKAGSFEDLDKDCQLRFRETDENCNYYLIGDITDRDKLYELPVLACGFVAWLIKKWKQDIQKTNEDYLNVRLNMYKNNHKDDDDADLRNLENEFYSTYKTDEEQWIKQSEAIFEYLTDDEVESIKSKINRYFRYVDSKMPATAKPQPQIIENFILKAIQNELIPNAPKYKDKDYSFQIAILNALHDFGFIEWLRQNQKKLDGYTFEDFCYYLQSLNKANEAQKAAFENTKKHYQNIVFKNSPDTKYQQITIPDNILQALQQAGFIENAAAQPLKWLKNKQRLRELLTYDKIKGTLGVAEIERQTPLLFIDKNGNALKLAKNKNPKGTLPPDYTKLQKILATL